MSREVQPEIVTRTQALAENSDGTEDVRLGGLTTTIRTVLVGQQLYVLRLVAHVAQQEALDIL